jgi:putative ubiquitin-RnfH superfamily antitoxin RatB of RatAB toxin-antitoxin module
MPKSRLSAFVYLFLVFAGGTAVGALGYRLYTVQTVLSVSLGGFRKAGPPDPEEARRRQVAEMKDRVKLDASQLILYNQILDKTREDFHGLHDRMNAEGRAIHDRQVAEVKAMLRPDQLSVYEQLLAEHEAARKRRLQQQNPPLPPR